MQARVMRITASVGCWIVASGTFSIRTWWAPGITVARIGLLLLLIGEAGEVFLVGNVLHPGHGRTVEALLDRDMGHGGGRRGAVPVLVLGRAPQDAPAWNSCTGPPSTWVQPTPSVTISVWPSGCVCHAVRAPR